MTQAPSTVALKQIQRNSAYKKKMKQAKRIKRWRAIIYAALLSDKNLRVYSTSRENMMSSIGFSGLWLRQQ